MCTLVSMSFVAPLPYTWIIMACHKRIVHPNASLANYPGSHKINMRLHECGSGVLLLATIYAWFMFALVLSFTCKISTSARNWITEYHAIGVYWRQYRSLLICLAVSAKKYASVSVLVPNSVSVPSHFARKRNY